MEVEELKALFEKHDDDYGKFDQVVNPVSPRKDICAFMMLNAAVPPDKSEKMVAAAEHDVIYLDVDLEELAKVATEDLIHDLVRCSVMLDEQFDCLSMFV